ncbi:hypothetical protein ACWEPZ_21120 [Streptomyces sp. NPDC004288]
MTTIREAAAAWSFAYASWRSAVHPQTPDASGSARCGRSGRR